MEKNFLLKQYTKNTESAYLQLQGFDFNVYNKVVYVEAIVYCFCNFSTNPNFFKTSAHVKLTFTLWQETLDEQYYIIEPQKAVIYSGFYPFVNIEDKITLEEDHNFKIKVTGFTDSPSTISEFQWTALIKASGI
ncbi:MAG: hypothetical protein N3A54_02595 [Patescibacteria group bacterium]|nr:hypothetical protein [Patescibacteria group bacterium]